MEGPKVGALIRDALRRFPRMRARYARPDPASDKLYKGDCEHSIVDGCCAKCGKFEEIHRDPRSVTSVPVDNGQEEAEEEPEIHYGLIGSGQKVVASMWVRDLLFAKDDIICFEMEAAGLDGFPCLTIRGISDYADAHKRDGWQAYAALSAAAYAKELLGSISPMDIQGLNSVQTSGVNISAPNSEIQINSSSGTITAVMGGLNIVQQPGPGKEFKGHYSYHTLVPIVTFVERKTLREDLEFQLKRTASDENKSNTVGIHGLGGVGKTQLVSQYLIKHRQSYSATFWIDAASNESIERDFLAIHKLLFPDRATLVLGPISLDDAIIAVKTFFHAAEGIYLFIFDNADSIDDGLDLQRFLPSSANVEIVVTSQSSTVSGMATNNAIEVFGMSAEESKKLLVRNAVLSDDYLDDPVVGEIVVALDYLPLAISIAGRYIAESRHLYSNLKGYLEDFYSRREKLLNQYPEKVRHNYSKSVLTTWETSYELIRRRCPEAARFLTLTSFIDSSNCCLDFFEEEKEEETKSCNCKTGRRLWHELVSSKARVDKHTIFDWLRLLQKFSFVQWGSDGSVFSIHRLVHAWGHDRLEKIDRKSYIAASLELLDAVAAIHVRRESTYFDPTTAPQNFSNQNVGTHDFSASSLAGRIRSDLARPYEYFNQRIRLVPHIHAGLTLLHRSWSSRVELETRMVAQISRLPFFLDEMAKYHDSYHYRLIHLEACCAVYGAESPNTLTAVNDVANSENNIGRFSDALKRFQNLLETKKRVSEEDHDSTLHVMHNLASVLSNLGRIAESLQLQSKVVEKRGKKLGHKNKSYLDSLHNFARMLSDAGDNKKGISLLRDCLATREETLGRMHPSTLLSMQNLSVALNREGMNEEAIKFGRVVVNDRMTLLGESHPDTFLAKINLATFLGDTSTGSTAEAIAAKEQVLKLSRDSLGHTHPHVVGAMNNLAYYLSTLGQQERPKQLFQSVLQTLRDQGQTETMRYSLTLSNLAVVTMKQGKLEEAEPIFRDVHELLLRLTYPEHPKVLEVRDKIGQVQDIKGNYTDAIELHSDVLRLRRSVLGEMHPDTLSSMNRLGVALSNNGTGQQALQIFEEIYQKRALVLGEGHPDTLITHGSYAQQLALNGNTSEAIPVQREILKGWTKINMLHHEWCLILKSQLSTNLEKNLEVEEAIRIGNEVLEVAQSTYGPQNPITLYCADEVARRNTRLGKD